ncbi:MAG: hypothetical protein QM627_06370 [Luteolibacter sp.]
MIRNIICLFILACCTFAQAAPPEADRKAILAMAGSFDVDFNFKEIAAIDPDYKNPSEDYHEDAFEVVVVAEDTPERITLQHLLVMEKPDQSLLIIKHWAQIWTWQDTQLLDYSGSEQKDQWTRVTVTAEQAKGKWSQLVTNIDDTPRYEALGKWTHEGGESSWTSEMTRRPLPRREYTKRKDYDYLLGTNRHTLTANGWAHFQDNRKVVDRDNEKRVLGFESGLNLYKRNDAEISVEGFAWWDENKDFWNPVRNFWSDLAQQKGTILSYQKKLGETRLSAKLSELQKAKAAPDSIRTELGKFIVDEGK